MKATGTNLLMNRACAFFLLLLFCGRVSAQLNTFESGQTIRADEMNENFEYLLTELERLKSKNAALTQTVTDLVEQNTLQEAEINDLKSIECSIDTLLEGAWLTNLKSDGTYPRELYTIVFRSDGTFKYYGANDGGTWNNEGTYEINGIDGGCEIKGSTPAGDKPIEFMNWMQDRGDTQVGTIFNYTSYDGWRAATWIKLRNGIIEP